MKNGLVLEGGAMRGLFSAVIVANRPAKVKALRQQADRLSALHSSAPQHQCLAWLDFAAHLLL